MWILKRVFGAIIRFARSQAFYSIRSERLVMERLEYDLLFRCFVELASTMRRGIIRCSRRTATGCWRATSPRSSWPRCWRNPGPQAITLGADKTYDAEDFVNELRSMRVTPHVAQNTSGRSSAIDGRTTRHGGYVVSQRIEEAFGWIKSIAGQQKTKFRGRDRVGWAFTFAAAAYNLVRLPKLMTVTG